MPNIVAVIDIGKTNAKLVLVDLATRTELAVRTTANKVLLGGAYPHPDAEALWRFIIEALGDLDQEEPIEAISIAAHGSSAALVTDKGLALPILDYEFEGPESASDAYDALRPPFSETLSPRLPLGLNLGAQIHWQQTAFPEQFSNAKAILTQPQYWAWRLTGVAASEVTSLGAHSDLWLPAERRLSPLVEKMGWTSLFPPLRSAFDILGTITAEVAEATGLDPETPVACGIHDSNASLLPHLLDKKPPFSVISTGTWAISFAVGGADVVLDGTRDCLANVNAYGDPVYCARFMAGREFEIMTNGKAETPDDAAIARVLSEQIMAWPTFTPGIGPFPKGKGEWSHKPKSLSAAERTAVASLYLALVGQTCLDLIGALGPTIIEGPFANNALYCAALKALTGRPVEAATGGTGTSIGASLLTLGPDAKPPTKAKPGQIVASIPLDGLEDYREKWLAKIG